MFMFSFPAFDIGSTSYLVFPFSFVMIGILQVQGLADVFALMKLPFDGPGARDVNRRIFETIYFAAMETTVELAKDFGPYESFQGSPASRGLLSPDLWGVVPITSWDWQRLRQDVQMYGMRNSLLVAPMPTASTSQIMGFNECFEPFTTNIYSRTTKVPLLQFPNPHRHPRPALHWVVWMHG